MRHLPLVLLPFGALGLAACGGDSSDKPDAGRPGEDAAVQVDGPPAPQTITITGTAVSRGLGGTQPVADAAVAGYRNSDEATPIGPPVMTDAQGNFTLVIDTRGEALDGFLKATKAGFKDTYLYPPAPIAADTTAPVNMIATNDFGLLSTIAQGNQQAGNGLIALVVVDGASATSMPVAGATVSSAPAASAYRYNASGLPNSQATATDTDGVAYMFNVPPNVAVTVSAMKAGTSFRSHPLKAWPDQLTTTLITP